MVYRPKKKGGLGIRKTTAMNAALLAKLGWKLEAGDQGLWAKVLRSKYLKGGSFINSTMKKASSHTWRSIYSSKDIVSRGCSKLVVNGSTTSFWYDKWLGHSSIAHRCNLEVPFLLRNDVVHDYWKDGTWDWVSLNSLPQDLLDQLSLVVLDDSQADRLFWNMTSDGEFSVKSAYSLLMNNDLESFLWNKIWKLAVSPRVKFFIWLMAHNRLLTRVACVKRGITSSGICSRCGEEDESILHALRDCGKSQQTWRHWLHGCKLDTFNSLSSHEWLWYNLSLSNFLLADGVPWPVLFSFVCWHLWKWRNCLLFEPGFEWPNDAASHIWAYLNDYRRNCAAANLLPKRQLVHIAWSCPPPGIVKVNVDASARSNPGERGIGGLCRDAEGKWLCGYTKKLGWGSITTAEIYAIYHGLTLAWEQGFRHVIIESDSYLAVHKIKQTISPRDPMFTILWGCQELLQRNWTCLLMHVYREANMGADYLASWAFNGTFEITQLMHPPGDLQRILQEDLMGVARPRAIVSP